MKILGRVLGFVDRVSFWSGKAMAYVLFPLIAVLVYGVVRRYVFNSPVIWTHELSLFMFGGIGVLVGAALLQMGAHIKVDIVYNRLSLKGRAVVDAISDLLLLYCIIVLLWQGVDFALYSIAITEHTSSVWGPVVYPFKTLIPIAAFIILLQGLAKFIRDLIFAIRGKALS
jgi:TRAP-type mannitol/chloroaromatic compound transport system permease small subunit